MWMLLLRLHLCISLLLSQMELDCDSSKSKLVHKLLQDTQQPRAWVSHGMCVCALNGCIMLYLDRRYHVISCVINRRDSVTS